MINYCEHCGTKNDDPNNKFCSGCGKQLIYEHNTMNNYNTTSVEKKAKNKRLPVWAIVLFVIGGFFAFCFALLILLVVFVDVDENEYDPDKQIEEKNDTIKSNDNISSNLEELSGEKLKYNFSKACEQIKMNISEIKQLKQVDDWNSGPRYTFVYHGQQFVLYALDNDDISSITIGNRFLDKIYLDGFEPLNVNNFLFSSSARTTLGVKAEDKIKSYLKYPSTADFSWTEYEYARRYNIYQIVGKVQAKNALGVEGEQKFTIEFKKQNNDFDVVYLNLGGKKYIGSGSQMKEVTRKEVQSSNKTSDNNSIVLKDGTLGKYGKKDNFDGEEYIRYYIPAGKYKVEAITKNAHFFVETIKLHKEDGWDTATTIKNIKLNESGDTTEFTITNEQCISLVIYTQIKLTKIK